MNKEKLIRGFKICIIIFLVLCITMVGLVHWKSDLIVRNVLSTLQSQLNDTLRYESAHMDAFLHFPCVSVQLTQLSLGAGQHRLIDHGDVAVVVRLLPLFHGAIDIDRVVVEDAIINIVYTNGKWSYDVLRKSEEDKEGKKGKSWKTFVHEMQLNHCELFYSDRDVLEFKLALDQTSFNGKIDPEILDITMDVKATLDSLKMDSYSLPEPVDFNLDGQYIFDFKNSTQQFNNWILENSLVSLKGTGNSKRNENDEEMDITGTWSDAKVGELIKWLPSKISSSWKAYTFYGKSDGSFEVKGKSSKTESPSMDVLGSVTNGGFQSVESKEEVKNVNVKFHYLSKDAKHQSKSSIQFHVNKKSTFGADLNGEVMIVDLEKPVMDVSIEGSLPAMLINLFSVPDLTVESGEINVEKFAIKQFRPDQHSFQQLMEKGIIQLESKELNCHYLKNPITWNNAVINSGTSKLHFEFDEVSWSKATANDLHGDLSLSGDQIQFAFQGDLCKGHVDSKGSLNVVSPVFQADWVVKDIDIRALMQSFSNFDQTFITSDNLSGKANIWLQTTIPMDENWKIKTREMVSKSAIEIHEGQLRNLKTLDDFSDYVHIEDLRDIRFNDLRNYLKIEGGQVYLPVMFIQSSAMNLSISGVHTFDQKIIYYLKLNAGQTVANKLRKTDFRKDLKSARKSGWINMYFVLDGTTADVHYKQYRTAVVSGFEQSTQLKESLRKELVDHFGYDVYWLEPNEWEDIPEYQ